MTTYFQSPVTVMTFTVTECVLATPWFAMDTRTAQTAAPMRKDVQQKVKRERKSISGITTFKNTASQHSLKLREKMSLKIFFFYLKKDTTNK